MAAVKPCGTVAAYKRHLAHGEEPCAACYDAGVQYRAEQNALESSRLIEVSRKRAQAHLKRMHEDQWDDLLAEGKRKKLDEGTPPERLYVRARGWALQELSRLHVTEYLILCAYHRQQAAKGE